ncbi:MAG: hypothetical protein KA260_02495 [Burkholderiales bacterium]|nr:hypothetical protein [Burkholderiales bacterium]
MSFFYNTQSSDQIASKPTSSVVGVGRNRAALSVVALVAAGLLSACATTQTATTTTTSAVDWQQRAAARALQRWQHISAGEYAKAYALHSAASRAQMNLDSFERTMKNLNARGAAEAKATCDQSICEVQLNVSVAARVARIGARLFQVAHKESWVVADGEVWFVQK